MLLLDPDRDGCTIFDISKNKIQRIKCSRETICQLIYQRITEDYKGQISGNIEKEQIEELLIDKSGIGMAYVEWFKDKGIIVEEFSVGKIIEDRYN
jgi:hypothetical protein